MVQLSRRSEYINARIDAGRTRQQATADYKWAATRWDNPGKWHASRTDSQRFVERRVSKGVKPDVAKLEAARVKLAGGKPTKWLAGNQKRLKELLAPKQQLEFGGMKVPRNTVRFEEVQEYIDFVMLYVLDDDDVDLETDVEEWASSGGGSTE